MIVYHYPFDKEGKNPYHQLLCQSLGCNDIECVGLSGSFWDLVRSLLCSKGQIFHFHWMHGIVTNRFFLISIIKILILYPVIIIWKLRKKTVFWTVHNLESHEKRRVFFDRLNSRFMAKLADRVLVHGQGAVGIVSKKFRINQQKIYVVPHGNYEGIVTPKMYQIAPGAVNFLYFGNIRNYKGVPKLIDSFQSLASGNKLHIAGRVNFSDIDMSNELTAKSGGCADVTFEFDYISNNRLEELLGWANIVVLPFTETFTSGSLLMALTAGRPVVVPRTGLIPEYVNSNCAFLYDPQEVQGLTNALIAVCQKAPDELKRMSSAALNQSKMYDWDMIGRELALLYRNSKK